MTFSFTDEVCHRISSSACSLSEIGVLYSDARKFLTILDDENSKNTLRLLVRRSHVCNIHHKSFSTVTILRFRKFSKCTSPTFMDLFRHLSMTDARSMRVCHGLYLRHLKAETPSHQHQFVSDERRQMQEVYFLHSLLPFLFKYKSSFRFIFFLETGFTTHDLGVFDFISANS